MSETLKRNERIRRRPEFQRVQEQGVRTRGRYMTLVVDRNRFNVGRLGIIATRRLGNASRRNRAKRLVREIFRLNKTELGLDIVVLPQRELPDAAFADLQADFQATLRRHGRRRQ